MTINYEAANQARIRTFPGINDSPQLPSETKAGNGSHLIQKHNALVGSVYDDILPEVLPNRFDYWHDAGLIINPLKGNKALFHHQTPGQIFGFTGRVVNPQSEDEFRFSIPLARNYYIMKLLGARDSDGGVLDIYANDQPMGRIDFYSPQSEPNLIVSMSSFEMGHRLEAGLCTFVFICLGNNGQTEGHSFPITKISIYPHVV